MLLFGWQYFVLYKQLVQYPWYHRDAQTVLTCSYPLASAPRLLVQQCSAVKVDEVLAGPFPENVIDLNFQDL